MLKHKNVIIVVISLFMLLVAAYANHFYNGFHFDDYHAVLDNVHIRTLSNIPQFFWDPTMFSADPEHFGLRPLVTTTLAIDYALGGSLNPFFFHLSTFIWHILLVVMLFFVYRRLMNDAFKHHWVNYIALFTAGLFAIHTANAETINYVISRSDVLSTFCIVASFLIYIAYPEKRKWFLYCIPAIIGVFAKETVLVLIILLFFYILLFEKKLSIADMFKLKNFKAVWNAMVMLLPILILVLIVQIYTLTRITAIPGISNPAGYYWLTQTYVWLHYFGSFFLPINLSADTDLNVITTIADRRILIGLVFVIALVIAIFRTSKKAETKPISFGLIWFAASLLPTSVAPFAEVMNDHRMYFAFVGLTLSVVWFISLWLIKKEKQIAIKKEYQSSIIMAGLLILSLHAYGVHQRNNVWYSEETLWKDVTLKSPLNGRGHMNYGLALLNQGLYTKAIYHFEKAQELTPSYSRVYTNIGIAKAAQGKDKEAEENFLKGIFLAPGLSDSYVYYARFLTQRKRFEEARKMGESALLINPQSIITLNLLMEVYQNLRLWGELERTSVMVLAILPNDETGMKYLDIARRKVNPGTSAKAPATNRELTAADYLNLSLAYYNMGDYEKCIRYCEEAIALKPDYADAYSNIAASYNKLKNWKKGIEASKKALEIDPSHKFAKGNLDWALSEQDK
jgi:tetratricopeptide (TPR) repeat protein